MRSPHLPDERLARILDLLMEQELASLAQLQAVTEASVATVRRDLDALVERGLIERTRGGARLVRRTSSLDEAFERRRRRDTRAKAAIAARAAALVPSGSALFLNDGTTMLALAEELARSGLDLWVATCALRTAEHLAGHDNVEVVVIGGSLRGPAFGTTGPIATDAIRGLHADIAFLGCDGLHAVDGVRSNSVHDAEVGQAFARQSDATIVVADATKCGNRARARMLEWRAVDRLVTDARDETVARAALRQGTELVRV